jgi:glycine/D-amino acid oxidase-like deaminating enzyme
MHEHSGSTNTVWRERVQLPEFGALPGDLLCDICIVGAGIAGLMTAYLLVREGKTVVVLDDGPIAGGETERTTAHLSNALDDRYYHLEKLHGESGSRLAAESHAAAISKIESICSEEGIDCDFQRLAGYLLQPPGADPQQLRAELAAALRAGVDVEEVASPPLLPKLGPALLFRSQAQFHPLKFLTGLVGCIQGRGGRFYCDTRVVTVRGGNSAFVEAESASACALGPWS